MQHDLVSVIIPCFNHGRYLPETIDSVHAQTYSDWEIIIVNDGSTDENTCAILNTIQQQENVTILHTGNQGPSAARNHGINHSKGKYILPLDADDIIAPSYIEKAVTVMSENSDVSIVYAQAELFGKMSGPWDLPPYSLKEILKENMIFCSGLYKRRDFDKTRGYNPNMKHGFEDWDFWLSLIELGGAVHRIEEPLFFYRISETSRTKQICKQRLYDLRKAVYRNHSALYIEHFEDPINLYFKLEKLKRSISGKPNRKVRDLAYHRKKWANSIRKRYNTLVNLFNGSRTGHGLK